MDSVPVQGLELWPICRNNQGISAIGDFVRIDTANDIRKCRKRLVHSSGIVGINAGTGRREGFVKGNSGRAANVVGISLVRQA